MNQHQFPPIFSRAHLIGNRHTCIVLRGNGPVFPFNPDPSSSIPAFGNHNTVTSIPFPETYFFLNTFVVLCHACTPPHHDADSPARRLR
jgi:hypothetical protein